jgi:uncharacterized iron-regulated membrane protein
MAASDRERFRSAPRRRPWVYRLHSVLGLYLSLFLGFICFTGTIATVSREIEWLLVPETRGTPTDRPASWGDRWDAARAAFPGVTLQSIQKTATESSTESYLATVVGGIDRSGGQIWIYVDPGDATVQGARRGVTFPVFMRGLHYYLFDPSGWVFYLVTLLGPVLIIMAFTGLRLYKKWWQGFLKAPRPAARPRAWWGQLHRFIAVWSLPFALIIGLTSVWYLLERPNILAWERAYPQLDRPMSPLAREWTGKDVERWISIAHRSIPDLEVTTIWLPWDTVTPIQIQGRRGDLFVRDRANRVAIDPNTEEVVAMQRVDQMPLQERWVHTADPLHFGDFAGISGKILWFVLGLGLTGLCFSGAVIYAKRTTGVP